MGGILVWAIADATAPDPLLRPPVDAVLIAATGAWLAIQVFGEPAAPRCPPLGAATEGAEPPSWKRSASATANGGRDSSRPEIRFDRTAAEAAAADLYRASKRPVPEVRIWCRSPRESMLVRPLVAELLKRGQDESVVGGGLDRRDRGLSAGRFGPGLGGRGRPHRSAAPEWRSWPRRVRRSHPGATTDRADAQARRTGSPKAWRRPSAVLQHSTRLSRISLDRRVERAASGRQPSLRPGGSGSTTSRCGSSCGRCRRSGSPHAVSYGQPMTASSSAAR